MEQQPTGQEPASDPEWGGYLRPLMPRRKERLRLQLMLGMMAVDLGAILIGFIIANILRFDTPFAPNGFYLLKVVAPIFLAIAVNNDAYSVGALVRRRYGIGRALSAFMIAIAAVTFLVFYLRGAGDYSRIAFSIGIAVSMLALIVGRMIFDRLARRAYGASPLSIVMIHDGAQAPAEPGVLLVDAAVAGLVPDARDPLMLDRLGRFLQHADRVVVACAEDRRLAWAMALKGANILGEIVDPDIARLGTLGTGYFAGSGTLVVSSGALSLPNRVLKRLLDVVLAVVGMVAIMPVLVATAIAIKLDDRGPVLFVQQRLGRGNRLFNMYKFRSMKTALLDHSGNRSASRDDDRITRVGRIIRKTSIDELPQLLNILKGDMSFVGPRPHALGSLAGDQLFWEVDQRYWHRHASKPGLTGLAQVRGFRGATLERIDLVNRLQADLEYLNGWTLARDIRILVATAKVLVHRNAF
ncbi:sugar transferase [Sphingomonas montana]|uniref:sugar transferase n=1 Tax=Sphingomonas montana TaxID=1843236 RepID=UPI0009FB67C5|nr:sugar transferase [Sphingomonas montana]